MTPFWIITLLIFAIVTFVLARLTLKKFKDDDDERIWKLHYGRSTYWQILTLCSFGITFLLMLALKYCDVIAL